MSNPIADLPEDVRLELQRFAASGRTEQALKTAEAFAWIRQDLFNLIDAAEKGDAYQQWSQNDAIPGLGNTAKKMGEMVALINELLSGRADIATIRARARDLGVG